MKKVDGKYLLKQMIVVVIVAIAIGVLSGVLLKASNLFGDISGGAIVTFMVILMLVVGIPGYAIYFAWGGSDMKAYETFMKGLAEHNFQNVSKFKTSNAHLAIDGIDGRIAYVANYNPYEFQLAELKDINNIRTDVMKGPLGGATAVWFSFIYNGRKTKVYTFLSNQAYSMQSREILEGISKADMYVKLLNDLKEVNNV